MILAQPATVLFQLPFPEPQIVTPLGGQASCNWFLLVLRGCSRSLRQPSKWHPSFHLSPEQIERQIKGDRWKSKYHVYY